jgi:peptidoglycan hydrolase-like protein with peptidoglycan-binding domain
MFHDKLGMIRRLDSKNGITEDGCDYDQGYITLDAQVLDNVDLQDVEHPEWATPATPAERARLVQKALRFLGYDPGPEDGKEGSKLNTAIATYRRDKKLRSDASEDDVRDQILLDAMTKNTHQAGEAVEKMRPTP